MYSFNVVNVQIQFKHIIMREIFVWVRRLVYVNLSFYKKSCLLVFCLWESTTKVVSGCILYILLGTIRNIYVKVVAVLCCPIFLRPNKSASLALIYRRNLEELMFN